MRVSYDDDADVLYLTFASGQGKVTYIETENGDILRMNVDSGEIVGVTIQLFQHRLDSGENIDIPEIGGVPFNVIATSLLKSRIVAGKRKP